MITSRMKRDIYLEWVGDFSWMFDPDIAATMIAAMVVGMGTDNKGFVVNFSGRMRQGISHTCLQSSNKGFTGYCCCCTMCKNRYIEGVSCT